MLCSTGFARRTVRSNMKEAYQAVPQENIIASRKREPKGELPYLLNGAASEIHSPNLV